MNDVTVAVINYNTRDLLRRCLASAHAECPDELIVVDNGSTDGSQEMVQTLFPQAQLYVPPKNLGFASGVNHAFAHSVAPYVLILNSDTVLEPGVLRGLRDYLEQNPCVGLVGPRLLNPDGSLQPSSFYFPAPLHFLLEFGSLSGVIGVIPWLRQRYLRTWSHDRARPVPWVLGAAMAIRRTGFDDVGGFDESFFMYSEEIDFCYRLWLAEWQTVFAPVGSVTHIGGASTSQQRVSMAVRAFHSTLKFYRRHYSPIQLMQLRLILGIGMGAKMIRDRLRLRYVSDPEQRVRLAEDMRIWQHVFRDVRWTSW